jgi:ATP/maltotriose-dependent transcriptional regulator MalT
MLNSKLTIPHLLRAFPRPRLHDLVQRLARKRLTLVVGGAGYGKTTLIANTIRQQKRQAVWYTLDETDQDFSTFMAYLLHGFKYFEPHIKRGQPSAYLKKHGVSFRLDPGDGGGIDAHEFMDQIKKGD